MARRRRRSGGRRSVRSTYSSVAGLAGRDVFDLGQEPKVPWVWLGLGAGALYFLIENAPGKGVGDLGAFWSKIPTSLQAGIVKAGGQVQPVAPWWANIWRRRR